MATYKIPSVIPNIKAARITASRDPYTNPQINVNKSFTAFSQGVQQGIKNGMIQRNNTKNYRAQEKAAQERRYAQQFELADNFAIENFETDTGSAQFDAGVENWLYKLKDNYIAISNGMLEHPDTYAYGSSELNKITNQVKTWQAVQPKLLEYIVDYKASLGIKPGDENSVSDTTPEALQTMIMGMLQGGPQVNLVEDDKGELNVYMAPQVFTNNLGEKEETNGYSLRLSGLLNDNLTGNDMIHYVPEYLKMATSAANELILGKSEGGTDNQVYTELFQEPIEGLDNQSGTYTTWKKNIASTNGGLQRHQKFLKVVGQEEEYKNPFYVADENDPSIGALMNGKDLAELNFLQLDTFDNISHSRTPGDNDAMILWTVKGLGNGEEWTGSRDQVMAVNAFMAKTATDEYQTKNGLRTPEQTGGIKGNPYETMETLTFAQQLKFNEDEAFQNQASTEATELYDELYNTISPVFTSNDGTSYDKKPTDIETQETTALDVSRINDLLKDKKIDGLGPVLEVKQLTLNELEGTDFKSGNYLTNAIEVIAKQPTFTREQVFSEDEKKEEMEQNYEKISDGPDGQERFIKKSVDMEKPNSVKKSVYDLDKPERVKALLLNMIKGNKGNSSKESKATQDALSDIFRKLKTEEAERANAKKLIEEN